MSNDDNRLGSLFDTEDARRASDVLAAVLAHRLPCALTGGLALTAHLHARGRTVPPRPLHDLDIVVHSFDDIPASVADAFVLNHVHPDAPAGKTLLQLIDARNRLRVDIFRAYGNTLARVVLLPETGTVPVVSLEDLRARMVAMLLTQLQRGLPVDRKHVTSYHALDGLGDPERLEVAWQDQRESLTGTFDNAVEVVAGLLQTRAELLVVEEYSREISACARCRTIGPFSPAPPEQIVDILGYW